MNEGRERVRQIVSDGIWFVEVRKGMVLLIGGTLDCLGTLADLKVLACFGQLR